MFQLWSTWTPCGGTELPRSWYDVWDLGKLNHFASRCRSAPTRTKNKHGRGRDRAYQVDSTPTLEFDDEVDFVFGVSGATGKSTPIVVKVHGVDTEVLVDSGATCNLVGLDTLRQLAMDVDILPCSRHLRPYGGNELPVCEMFKMAFQLNQTTVQDEVIVIRGTGEFLLGKTTAVALNALVRPEVNTVRSSAEQL